MQDRQVNPPHAAAAARRRTLHWLALILLAFTCTTGCGGCGNGGSGASGGNNPNAQAEEEEEKEEEKRDYEFTRLTPLLSEKLINADDGEPLRLVKPGHWTSVVQTMQANYRDVEGRTTAAAVDKDGRQLRLEDTQFSLNSSRPAVLVKGRPKRVESELFVPADVRQPHVSIEVIDRGGGRLYREPAAQWTAMPSQQYFLLVLAREPARYGYLSLTDAVRFPYEHNNGVDGPHYRVVLADAGKPLPLPPNALAWTSVAHVLWDDVNPDRLDPAQQTALIDWLHWGGRLIISGPDSLDGLRNSFLAPYLPVESKSTLTFHADDLAELSEVWGQRPDGENPPPLVPREPLSGLELSLLGDARALPGAKGILVERSVGLGSVVVSAIRLTGRDLVNWPGFDSFLHGAVLRRPGREYRRNQDFPGLQTTWADYPDRSRDAHFTTPLRWFSRDAQAKANVTDVTAANAAGGYSGYSGGYGVPGASTAFPLSDGILTPDQPGGLGQWSEFGAVASAAREALTAAAGVRVPSAVFVLGCLAVYLIALAPLNWAVFHTIGRVEWAWISAPIIAILGAVVVVRQAQLDIGFVRSNTEIAVLELHGDYPRGHLTRYSALYSSLSTTYEIGYRDSTAVAMPFPPFAGYTPLLGERPTQTSLDKYDEPRLRGITISSASTQFVHSEQMYGLNGAVRLGSPSNNPNLLQLENGSELNLSDAMILRLRDASGDVALDAAWLGAVRGGQTVLLRWEPLSGDPAQLPFAAERQSAAATDYRKRLDVDALIKLACQFPAPDDPLQGQRDEYRLVARIDDVLPGAEASPAASQVTGATVVLAHLRLGPPPPTGFDVNSANDVDPNRSSRSWDFSEGGGLYEESYDE